MKKFLSLLLAAMMIISVLPTAALADGMKTLDMAPAGEVSTPAEEPTQPAEPAQPAEQEQPAAPAEEPAEQPAAEENEAPVLKAPAAEESKVVGKVWVGFENSTWITATEASDNKRPPWRGLRTPEAIDLKEDSTMMSIIVDKCKIRGYEIIGADEGYIRSIDGIAEFDNGPESGWMGTLNGWFTNKGFANYSVADGTLKDGDEIILMYTSTGYGKDIGADWETGDKTVKQLLTKNGELMPAFSPDIHEYKFLLEEGATEARMYPIASNQQFQIHMYIGDTEYAVNSQTKIPVSAGDELVIKCGDPSWESAAPNSGEAQVYTVKFVSVGEMLNENSVSVKTIKEDGKSEGDEATMKYDSSEGTFTATTVRKYTQLAQYNDVGFTATVSGLPEGAVATLFADDGSKVGEFVDGKITLADALKTIGYHNYSIVVKNGDVEETYKFVVEKSPKMRLYNEAGFTAKPGFNEENIFNGQPEGTLFHADKDGNPTGEVGYEGNCWNYVMYVSPDVTSIAPNSSFKPYDRDINRDANVSLYVNDKLITEQEKLSNLTKIWRNSPVLLENGKNEYKLVFVCRTDPTIEVTYKLTVYVVRTEPSELVEKINALPAVNDLTYEANYGMVMSYDKVYEGYTEEEKAQVPADVVKKLKDSVEKVKELKERFDKVVNEFVDLVNSAAGKVNAENYRDYLDGVRKSVELFLGMSDGQRTALKGIIYQGSKNIIDAFWENYNAAILPSIKNGESIGYPTDYPDDFIVQSGYYNLDLGHEDTYYQTGFREIWTNRPTNTYYSNEKGLPFTSPGLLEFEVKDESIVEIKEVESTYTDMGLGGSGNHPNMLYYLVPKKAGTTTFTVKMRDEAGVMYCQTPEIVVHVNSPEESATEKLYQKLTDFTAHEYTRRYDNWTYEYGKPGAEFSFHINGTNGKVWVYNYLEYNADGTPVKTEYKPNANGDVTILLKDGYNCIEVNADYEGKNVTQVYSLKGKVTKNIIENISRPGEALRKGDNAGVWIIGRPICLHKILRIYNNGNGATSYISNMPRQGMLKTDESIPIKYLGFNSAGEANNFYRLFVPLTASGDIVLYDGYIQHAGYGSGLGSELTQGNTGGMADSTQFKFGQLANITLKGVEDNPDYVPPKTMKTEISRTVVKAGETVTITVPELPTEEISHDYDRDKQNKIRYATTRFYTDIPGMPEVEVSYKRPDQNLGEGVPTVNDIKTITVTIPEETPAGVYNFHGGNLELAYTLGWMDHYDWFYRGLIDDVSLTVLPSDATAVRNVENLIAAIGTVTKDSGNAIKAARDAYNALTEEQKALVSKEALDTLVKAEKIYDMIIASNKPAASGKEESTGSVIHIAANGASKGEKNPNTGAPAMSMAPAVLVLAAAALVLKKRG